MPKVKRIIRRVPKVKVPAKPIVQLADVYMQINEIIRLTHSPPSMCYLISSNSSSIVISRYKNSVKLICDIPDILMGFTISKIKKNGQEYYVCTISSGVSWYYYTDLLTIVSEIDFNTSLNDLDEYDVNNLLMLLGLIYETYNNLLIVNGGNES